MSIASATNTMTAVSILKLQNKKLLNVHNLLIKYLNSLSGV